MIRNLDNNDFNKGFIELINTFTRYPEPISFDRFSSTLKNIEAQGSFVFVIEEDTKIVATTKLVLEQKFHNNCKRVGHIEDVVTHIDYRKKGYASQLIQHCIEVGKQENCYKVILCANENNVLFYEKLGFMKKGTELSIYAS